MEFEQISKRLEWLDEQQRGSKIALSDLGERLTSLETSVNALTKQLKGLSTQMADMTGAAARLNQFDQIMTKQRSDLNKIVGASEKRAQRREQEAAKLHRADLDNINKVVTKLNDFVDGEERKIKDRAREQQSLNLAVQDLRAKTDEIVENHKEFLQAQKDIEETRRQDAKRLTDLQGESASIRKRADEAREKTTLHSDSIRDLENRFNELYKTETGRREAQADFDAEQLQAQAEREWAWKDFQQKYEVFKKQAGNMEVQVTALDDTIRAARRAQDAYAELNQKLDRRIAEVTEMQRLAEDRVRQEWVAFKSDEQKRWTSHSLTQEEAMRDLRKGADKMEQRLTALDDIAQTMQDQLHQTTDTTEKQLQELMNLSNEWLTAYERIMGHSKTKPKKSPR